MTRERARDPADLAPRDAKQRWIDHRKRDLAASTTYTYDYQLRLFADWCEEVGIERVGDLRPYDISEYQDRRAAKVVNVTLREELSTLRQWLEYLDDSLDAVEDDLADAIDPPEVDKGELTNETVLAAEDALALLRHYRSAPEDRGTRDHAQLELAWFTGARRGGLRALDVRDVDLDDGYVNFVHRSETDTPLKNKIFGERSVSLPDEAAEAVRRYVEHRRPDTHDDEGRQPLLPSRVGRPVATTVTDWSYRLTQPCIHGPCPHGRERETCEYTRYNQASKCPSSRSMHPVRSGSITWQLNSGVPEGVVAGRVNASLEVIRHHYDWATEQQRWRRHHEHREKRQRYLGGLQLDTGEEPDDTEANA